MIFLKKKIRLQLTFYLSVGQTSAAFLENEMKTNQQTINCVSEYLAQDCQMEIIHTMLKQISVCRLVRDDFLFLMTLLTAVSVHDQSQMEIIYNL